MVSKKSLNYQKIPHSACCMISILLHKGFSISQCAESLGTTERTIERILRGGRPSKRLHALVTAYYLNQMYLLRRGLKLGRRDEISVPIE